MNSTITTKKFNLLVLFISIFFVAPLTAQEYELNFEIVNHTGLSLYGVYVTDTDQDNWGDDIIPYDRFEDNTTVTVTIPIDNQTLCEYDIRVDDDEENGIEFKNIDFCDLDIITILMDDDGELYYTLE